MLSGDSLQVISFLTAHVCEVASEESVLGCFSVFSRDFCSAADMSLVLGEDFLIIASGQGGLGFFCVLVEIC